MEQDVHTGKIKIVKLKETEATLNHHKGLWNNVKRRDKCRIKNSRRRKKKRIAQIREQRETLAKDGTGGTTGSEAKEKKDGNTNEEENNVRDVEMVEEEKKEIEPATGTVEPPAN